MPYARAAAARGYRSARRFCGTRSHERVPEAAIPTARLSPRCARRARRGRRPRARTRAGGQAVGCFAEIVGKLARLDGGVRRQRIQRRQRAIRIAIDFREHRMHDRLPLLPPLRGELRKTCILRDAAGECRGRRDQIFSIRRNSGREGFGPFLVVGDTPFPLDRKAERNARPLPELGHLLPLLGNPGPTRKTSASIPAATSER